jgi:hypothetical protein
MATVCGKASKEIHTSVNGGLAELKGMECMFGKTEIDTKENGRLV